MPHADASWWGVFGQLWLSAFVNATITPMLSRRICDLKIPASDVYTASPIARKSLSDLETVVAWQKRSEGEF
jgi:hypothetical protein